MATRDMDTWNMDVLSFGIYPWNLTIKDDGGGPFQGMSYLIHPLLYIIWVKYVRWTCIYRAFVCHSASFISETKN
jgi:hypothetical protein